MEILNNFIRQLGFALCHQLPERSISFGGRSMPVCARDAGLLAAFFLVLLILTLPGRRGAGWPRKSVLIACGAGIGFLAFDGLSSYMGLRETGNVIRFLSGLAGGAGLAVPMAVLFNRYVFNAPRERSPLNPKRTWAVTVVLAALCLLFLSHPAVLFQPAQILLALSIMGTFIALNLLLLYCLREWTSGQLLTRLALLPCVLALLLAAAELLASNRLHVHFTLPL